MITTNLLELVDQLNIIGAVTVRDSSDTIELYMGKPVDVQEMDDLVCDALFADPLARHEDRHGWTIRLLKLDRLRGSSDMHVVSDGSAFTYVLDNAA